MTEHKVLINGRWQAANSASCFQAFNPTTGEALVDSYPQSSWQDCDLVLDAATEAYQVLQKLDRRYIADFLECYASKIEKHAADLVDMAHLETGLAKSPRLADVEIPRTTNQLRQAAKAVLDASWSQPTIDSQNNIRSMLTALGPVAVFGPNNFPFAFGSISGGDFAAAIAAGNPVIAKAHPSHPGTTRIFAELALEALLESGLPAATVQLIYAIAPEDGLKLVADKRIAATGFTGSQKAGLALKAAADKAGKLIYLELSSLNPVIVLGGALSENTPTIAEAFAGSCTIAAGQLCTKPGLLILPTGEAGNLFIEQITKLMNDAPCATLLSPHAATTNAAIADDLEAAGAQKLTQTEAESGARFCHPNTLLSVSGEDFIQQSERFQQEIFGNAALIIRSESVAQTQQIIAQLHGNLTGCIYSHSGGEDDAEYDLLEPVLRQKVGRILNDKMPTGVAVTAAMNHGGPFPSSGHPGFSAVGLPGSIRRFAALKCFDNVRQARLPDLLRDKSPGDNVWRLVDGVWTRQDVA